MDIYDFIDYREMFKKLYLDSKDELDDVYEGHRILKAFMISGDFEGSEIIPDECSLDTDLSAVTFVFSKCVEQPNESDSVGSYVSWVLINRSGEWDVEYNGS